MLSDFYLIPYTFQYQFGIFPDFSIFKAYNFYTSGT